MEGGDSIWQQHTISHKLPIKKWSFIFPLLYYKLINYRIIMVCVQYIKMSTYLLKLVYYKTLTIITDGLKWQISWAQTLTALHTVLHSSLCHKQELPLTLQWLANHTHVCITDFAKGIRFISRQSKTINLSQTSPMIKSILLFVKCGSVLCYGSAVLGNEPEKC